MPPETVKLWALDVVPFEYDDAVNAVRRMGRTSKHPDLATFIECIREERDERLAAKVVRLPVSRQIASEATSDPEQALRNEVGRQLAIDMALHRVPPET